MNKYWVYYSKAYMAWCIYKDDDNKATSSFIGKFKNLKNAEIECEKLNNG